MITNTELQKSFPLHSRVLLESCPYGAPGTVVRHQRGKVVVRSADLGPSYIGKHSPERLMLADVAKEPL